MQSLKIISAGAGSGKTYRLTNEMATLLSTGGDGSTPINAKGIYATTFTTKSAAELQERVRLKLLEEGMVAQAEELSQAMIGTVHSLGMRMMQRFAFEAGVSPDVRVMSEQEAEQIFANSLSSVYANDIVEEMEAIADRMGFYKTEFNKVNWKDFVKNITEIARSNDLSLEVLEKSKEYSLSTFWALLPQETEINAKEFHQRLVRLGKETISLVEDGKDTTIKTKDATDELRQILRQIDNHGQIKWYEWAKLCKLTPGAKSKELFEPINEAAALHIRLPQFKSDIEVMTNHLFNLAKAALASYAEYKRLRGFIDYTDMEVAMLRLMDDPEVREVLADELELLLVDEFQDTSPIQLQIFLKMTSLAKKSIWVGDPKQSIYGFRGAEPALMNALLEVCEKEALTHSWRSRESLVNTVNAIFVKAFPDYSKEMVALAVPEKKKGSSEHPGQSEALRYWHFEEEGKSKVNKGWLQKAVTFQLAKLLKSPYLFTPKDGISPVPLKGGDVAILCRSNKSCEEMAEALSMAGLEAATARAGLMETREAKLLTACIKYIASYEDNLSIAEILYLVGGHTLDGIVRHRLEFLKSKTDNKRGQWAKEEPFIQALELLKRKTSELSPYEVVSLVMEELDLRRIASSWSSPKRRIANLDLFRKLVKEYEEACMQLNKASTLSGFLVWLDLLSKKGKDEQAVAVDQNTIRVLTYHKSKGLEWPLVICMDLDNKLRSDVFGPNIVRTTEEVNLEAPLEGRLIRCWLNPYADQKGKMPLIEAIEQSDASKEAHIEALREEARLMYVGLTRARDYLVLPNADGLKTGWLNRVFHGDESKPTLMEDTNEALWLWEGEPQHIAFERFAWPLAFEQNLPQRASIVMPQAGDGYAIHVPLVIDTKREKSEVSPLKWKTGSMTNYGDEFDFGLMPEYEGMDLLCALLGVDFNKLSQEAQRDRLGRLMSRFESEAFFTKEMLWEYWEGFQKELKRQFSPSFIEFQKEVSGLIEGRKFELTLDYLLETQAGLIGILNHPSKELSAKLRLRAADWAKSLGLAAHFLQEQGGLATMPRIFVHFPGNRALIEIEQA